MALANLFNIPENEEELFSLVFNNMDQHRLIVKALFDQRGVSLLLYTMDPLPPDIGTWLQVHQQAHNDFTAALGIEGVDLTSVNFHDPEQLASWARLHGEEHRQAANILGFG